MYAGPPELPGLTACESFERTAESSAPWVSRRRANFEEAELPKQSHRTVAGDPPREIKLRALSHGGFLLGGANEAQFDLTPMAAFTNLSEALAWLAANMAQPVAKPVVFVKKG